MTFRLLSTIFAAVLVFGSSDMVAASSENEQPLPDTLITFWPLIDYRVNSAKKASKLSILGPILNFERNSEDRMISLRPLFHSTSDVNSTRNFSYYLYPLASSETTVDVSRFETLQILQKSIFRKTEPDETERQFMLFPFIISGDSEKYGPYTSIFPIYGDIYERFWRDEYHYALFPIYGRTVNKGTTNYNILWPFFSITSGENEAGYRFWPLYGQSSKEGNYSSRFVLWPFFSLEERNLDTAEPSRRLNIFPLYAHYSTPSVTSYTWLWPFFGYSTDSRIEEVERDYLWPFWLTVKGKKRNVIRFLPFYANESTDDTTKNWYLWPFYRHDTLHSSDYSQKRDSILFFLFSNKVESWARDDRKRSRTALWPLLLHQRDIDGENRLSLPAPVEPILDKDGIEKLWAPLWRVYVHHWNDKGDQSLSLFWNLYWHDCSKDSLGWELFPFIRQRNAPSYFEVQILKGLLNYTEHGKKRRLSLFWTPFGFDWQKEITQKETSH